MMIEYGWAIVKDDKIFKTKYGEIIIVDNENKKEVEEDLDFYPMGCEVVKVKIETIEREN